jgi:carbamate kinase
LAAGCIVIAAGGGGIPVIQNKAGELRELRGAYAVIDKDRASSLLAAQLKLDLLLISTGIEQVALDFNTPQQRFVGEMSTAEAEQYLAEGHFAPGSMRPKIEAVINFVRQTGKPALITDPNNLDRALRRETGTWITRQ